MALVDVPDHLFSPQVAMALRLEALDLATCYPDPEIEAARGVGDEFVQLLARKRRAAEALFQISTAISTASAARHLLPTLVAFAADEGHAPPPDPKGWWRALVRRVRGGGAA